jgi:hypothetical protein
MVSLALTKTLLFSAPLQQHWLSMGAAFIRRESPQPV